MASIPFTAFPIHGVTRMDSQPFRVLLVRRLRLLSPLSNRACVCGGLPDVLGHHRAACGVAGVVESVVEQICREIGARVSTNVVVRNLDIATRSADGRRLEVVGLSQWPAISMVGRQ